MEQWYKGRDNLILNCISSSTLAAVESIVFPTTRIMGNRLYNCLLMIHFGNIMVAGNLPQEAQQGNPPPEECWPVTVPACPDPLTRETPFGHYFCSQYSHIRCMDRSIHPPRPWDIFNILLLRFAVSLILSALLTTETPPMIIPSIVRRCDSHIALKAITRLSTSL